MKKEIKSTNAPAAIGPYSQAIEANGFVYLSGQLPIDPKTGEFVKGGIKEQTEQVFKNIEAVLVDAGLELDNIVKSTVLLSNMDYFGEMNEVYKTKFSGIFPARSAFAVKNLPKDASVEIEVIAAR